MAALSPELITQLTERVQQLRIEHQRTTALAQQATRRAVELGGQIAELERLLEESQNASATS